MKFHLAIRSTLSLLTGVAFAATLHLAPGSAWAKPEHGAVYKDWTAACETPPAPEGQTPQEQCYIFQTVSVKETKKTLLRLAVGHLGKERKPAAIVTVPLGIFLPPGFAIAIDKAEPTKFPVHFCNGDPAPGCRGILPLSNALIAQMKRGNRGQVIFFDGTRREIGIPISLLGFTAGFDALNN